MNGWGIALALLAAYVLAAIIWNMRFKAEQRQLAQSRPDHNARGFVDLLTGQGVPDSVSEAVLAALRPYYAAGAAPHPDDLLGPALQIDAEEIGDIVECAWTALALPMPSNQDPEQVPAIKTVGQLAAYLADRHAALAVH